MELIFAPCKCLTNEITYNIIMDMYITILLLCRKFAVLQCGIVALDRATEKISTDLARAHEERATA
jgi:hypothetical protein